jgi:hypothetical protein
VIKVAAAGELRSLKPMKEAAKDLIGEPDLATQLLKNDEFITDMCRFSESLLTEKFIRQKYGKLDEAAWEALGSEEALIERVETEKIRRTRNGSAKRERAQQHIIKGPDILEKIMSDEKQNSRHRIDAIKTLDIMSDTGPDATPADTSRFLIQINLGADQQLRWNKSIKPNPHDVDPDHDVENVPPLLAIMASKQTDGGGSGNAI